MDASDEKEKKGVYVMETLGEREVADMIVDLRASEKTEGTCKEHGLLTRSAVLSHRQQEQTYLAVVEIKTEMGKLSHALKDENTFIGGFRFGKRQANGLVAVVFVIGLFLCVFKWGPGIGKIFASEPPKAIAEKVVTQKTP